MKIDRHQARILAVQLLAQLDVQGDGFWDEAGAFLSEAQANEPTRAYAEDLARRCWTDRAKLDERITAAARHWSLDRMSLVDRNVVRAALVELGEGDVPPKIVINEAVEISKEYGSADSARFVNGLLDAMWKEEGTKGRSDEGTKEAEPRP